MSTLPGLWGVRPEAMTVVHQGQTLGQLLGQRMVSANISLSITQASTLTVVANDPTRDLLRSPLLNEASIVDTGASPSVRFALVKIAKSKQQITLTFEDALINTLRQYSGAYSAAKTVYTRAGFAAQLCQKSGNVPFKIVPVQWELKAQVPLTRGTSAAPSEDTWSCLVRLAADIDEEVFSDGHQVVFGPDNWLLSGSPLMQLTEISPNVDYIDFDHDVGKKTAEATVYTYADRWTAPLGGHVRIVDMGPASGEWIVSQMDRDLAHSPLTVKLTGAKPRLAEPTTTS